MSRVVSDADYQGLLAFRVIIAEAQMFLEILLGVAQTVLRFGCKHTSYDKPSGRACVNG